MGLLEKNAFAAITASSRRSIIGSIAISIAFVMELTLVPLVLPAIQAHYGLSIGEIAWVFNSYGVSVALGVILGGWLGDVLGIRKVFNAGVLMFAAGAAIVAFAGSYETVVAARVLQGFGGGIFSPLVPLLLTRALPDRPGKILIIWGSVTGYVAAFAPLALSQTIASAGWQSAFVLISAISLAALAINGKMYSNSREPAARTLPNLILLLKARNLWLVLVYIFCTYGAITFYLFRLPLRLAEIDYDVTTIGFVLATIWLSFSIGGTLLRNWVDGRHVRSIMLAAPLLIASGFQVVDLTGNLVWFAFSAALIGIGLACSNAPSTQMVLKFAPRGLSALSASLDITFARLGGVVTVAVLAQSEFASTVPVIVCMSLAAMVCALISLHNNH